MQPIAPSTPTRQMATSDSATDQQTADALAEAADKLDAIANQMPIDDFRRAADELDEAASKIGRCNWADDWGGTLEAEMNRGELISGREVLLQKAPEQAYLAERLSDDVGKIDQAQGMYKMEVPGDGSLVLNGHAEVVDWFTRAASDAREAAGVLESKNKA